MKKLLTIIALMGLFQGQANAQYLDMTFTLKPNPVMEGQVLTMSLYYQCGIEWSNKNVSVNGSDVDFEITYINEGCGGMVPPAGGYGYTEVGTFPAGDYQLNITVLNKNDQSVRYQETIPFGVLAIKSVPVAANFMYLILISLTLLLGGFWLRQNNLKV